MILKLILISVFLIALTSLLLGLRFSNTKKRYPSCNCINDGLDKEGMEFGCACDFDFDKQADK